MDEFLGVVSAESDDEVLDRVFSVVGVPFRLPCNLGLYSWA
jgi:hypothetical protein